MANYSDLFAPAATSPIKSIQTGYASSTAPSSGSGEDTKYLDVTISAVTAAKSVVMFEGGAGPSASAAMSYASTNKCTYRLTSSTNLRISNFSQTAIVGRWQVVEYN